MYCELLENRRPQFGPRITLQEPDGSVSPLYTFALGLAVREQLGRRTRWMLQARGGRHTSEGIQPKESGVSEQPASHQLQRARIGAETLPSRHNVFVQRQECAAVQRRQVFLLALQEGQSKQ